MPESIETSELSQELEARLANPAPMTHKEWSFILEKIYSRLNNPKNPDYNYELWEKFLERGIDELAALVSKTTAESIKSEAEKQNEDENSQFLDPKLKAFNYLNNSDLKFWLATIIRMLDPCANTSPETISRLGEKVIEKIGVPLTKLRAELAGENVKIKRHIFLDGMVRNILIATKHSLPSKSTFSEYEADVHARITKILEGIK